MLFAVVYLVSIACVRAQFPNCTKANTAFCETPSVGLTVNNIIFRCPYDTGSAVPGNCNDDLADVPPIGIKYAYCWETSPTAGDAQCTFNCVSVTAANGTTFYPAGCNTTTTASAGSSMTNSVLSSGTSLSSFSPSTSTSSLPSASTTQAASTSSHPAQNQATHAIPDKSWLLVALAGGALGFQLRD